MMGKVLICGSIEEMLLQDSGNIVVSVYSCWSTIFVSLDDEEVVLLFGGFE